MKPRTTHHAPRTTHHVPLFLLLAFLPFSLPAQKLVIYDANTLFLGNTNLLSSNHLAGTGVTITKGPQGQLTYSAGAVAASGYITNQTNFGHVVITNAGNGSVLELTTNAHINAADESGTRLLTGTNALFRLTNTTSSVEASNGNLKISGTYTGLASGLTNANGKALVTQTEIGTASNASWGLLIAKICETFSSTNLAFTFSQNGDGTTNVTITLTNLAGLASTQTNDTTKIPNLTGVFTNALGYNLTLSATGTSIPLLITNAVGNTNDSAFIGGTNSATGLKINAAGVVVVGSNQIAGFSISNLNSGVTRLRTSNGESSAIYQTVVGVGIGTNNPQSALHVVGDGTFTGGLALQGASAKLGYGFASQRGCFMENASVINFNDGSNSGAAENGDVAIVCPVKGSLRFQAFQGTVPLMTLYTNQTLGLVNCIITNSLGIGTTTPAAKLDNQGQLRTLGLALSNINGSASTLLMTNLAVNSNCFSYPYSSSSGSNLTLWLPTNAAVLDGTMWMISLDASGTNTLSITPTNFAAPTADKIQSATNWVITPGTAVGVGKQGSNYYFFSGLPTDVIGTVKAWDKSLPGICTNLGSSWVECNGQTLSDPASRLNGQTIRNLNGNNSFLRGNTTSGSTGGAATHTHGLPALTGEVNASAYEEVDNELSGSHVPVAAAIHAHNLGGSTDAGSTLPPYTDMVWIMRVK